MTDRNPELIDKAARALWDEPGWEQATHEQRQHHREAAERALSSVADDLRAEALEDAADEIEAEYDRRGVVAVGAQYQYNSGVLDGLDIAEWVVRARAAELREADK